MTFSAPLRPRAFFARFSLVALSLLVAPSLAAAQSAPRLSIIAGDGTTGTPIAGPALASPMGYPAGIAADNEGNVYVHDGQYAVERISPDGALTHVAGNGTSGVPVPGAALSSPIGYIYGLATDQAANVYIADSDHCQILRVTPAGTLSIVAGNGVCGTPVPGPATSSPLGSADNLGVDQDGYLYIGDYDHRQFLKVTPDGTLSVFAGDGTYGQATPGPALSSHIVTGYGGMGFDSAGALYSANDSQVVKITRSGTLSVVASSLNNPAGVAVDSQGNVYVAESGANVIDKITPAGTLTQYAGNVGTGPIVNGDLTSTPLAGVYALTIDAGDVLRAFSGDEHQMVRIGAPGPSAPRSVSVVATSHALDLTFTAPANPGEQAISGYEYSLDGGQTWTTLATTPNAGALTGHIDGLQDAHTYQMQLRAKNAIATGTATATLSTATAALPTPTPTPSPTVAATVTPTPTPAVGAAPVVPTAPVVTGRTAAKITSRALTVSTSRGPGLSLTVHCAGDRACSGTIKVNKYVRIRGRVSKISVGSARYAIAANQDGTVPLTLTAPGRRYLGLSAPRLLHATASNVQASGTTTTALTVQRQR